MSEGQCLYLYHPIRENEIRLCRFRHETDYISVELKVFLIDNLPRYQVVSYVWSPDDLPPTRNWSVKIDGAELSILDTLRPFIETLRAKEILSDDTWWWIDSLCIDLTNTKERSLQIQMMRRMYSDCCACICWLGEEFETSARTLDFIQHLHGLWSRPHDMQETRLALQQEHEASWLLLEAFFARKWWSRVWTIQEFVLPPVISFWCGSQTFSRTEVYASLIMADRCDTTGFRDSVIFRQAWNRMRVWRLQEKLSKPTNFYAGLSLPALATYCCTNDATNDIDRLYGLHGLSSIDRELLKVDYSQSANQIYLQFTKSFIEKHGSLDLIVFASLFPSLETSSLPSWVPDWRQTHSVGLLVVPLMVSQSANPVLGNLRPPAAWDSTAPPLCYRASGDRPAVFSFEDSTLCIRGFVIDHMNRFGDHAEDQEPGYGITSKLSTTTRSSEQTLLSVCRSLVLDRHDRYFQQAMPAEEFFADFLKLCALSLSNPSAVQPQFLQWFNQVRHLQIDGSSLEATLAQYLKGKDGISPENPPNQEEYIQNSFFGRFYDTIVRMSLHLTVTRNNRIGLVSENARKNDLICILYGCSVPILLRKMQDEDAYTLIGECFIDQCMSGEALQTNHAEITFRIR